ncbi:MAG TPA: hypothetical protein VK781_09245 [Solirubrobacteraceae bacterium]|jgi:hypothetical protein|nr:hypothetical protein [Solirubrobacteraceae bacterium]
MVYKAMIDGAKQNLDARASRYRRRIVDDELDELIAGLPAIALEGPKAVGKTAAALRRAETGVRLDNEAERSSPRLTRHAFWRASGPC